MYSAIKEVLKILQTLVFCFIFEKDFMTRESVLLTTFINFLKILAEFPPQEKIASECSDLHMNPAAADKEERGYFGHTEIVCTIS